MPKVAIFVEDFGHEAFLTALLGRLSRHYQVGVEVKSYGNYGGRGQVLSALRQFIRDLQRGREPLPYLVVVATDGNCRSFLERQQDVTKIAAGFAMEVVCAVPDPHLERWLLLDAAAFKEVLGRGCAAPDQKCERDRYKRLLLDAMGDAGISPPLGGVEYAEEIVRAMDLQRMGQANESLRRLLNDLHRKFKEWGQV